MPVIEYGDNQGSGNARIDIIETVKTPLGFFTLSVLVVEAILGITAGFTDGVTRAALIIGMIGLTFLLVIIVAVLAFIRPEALSGHRPAAAYPSTMGNALASTPAITTEEARNFNVRIIAGKFGDFIIEDPRPNWNIGWKSLSEILKEETGMADQDFYTNVSNAVIGDNSSNNILQIRSKITFEVTPQPGVSHKNGLPYLYLSHATIIPEIAIFSKNKFASNISSKESILSYSLDRLSGILLTGSVPQSIATIIRDDGRPAVVFEAESRLENFTINNIPDRDLTIKITGVCIESQSRLYTIMLQYASGDLVPLSDIDRLHKIISSFRITEDHDEFNNLQNAINEGRFLREQWVKNNAEKIAGQNYYFLINQLAAHDLDDHTTLPFVIKKIDEFATLIRHFKVDDDAYQELMRSLQNAKQGNPEELISLIKDSIRALINRNGSEI